MVVIYERFCCNIYNTVPRFLLNEQLVQALQSSQTYEEHVLCYVFFFAS